MIFQSFPQVERQGPCIHWNGQHGSKSPRQLCKRNLYNTSDPPANYSKNRTRRAIPSKATQSHGSDLGGHHPAMSPTLVVGPLVGKGGHTKLGWASPASPNPCVRHPKARRRASQQHRGLPYAVLAAAAATRWPHWQRATAAPVLLEEPPIGEGAAWEGAERSNRDIISLEKLSPGAGLLQPLLLWHRHLCLSFLLRKSGSTNIYTVKGPGGGSQCLHC